MTRHVCQGVLVRNSIAAWWCANGETQPLSLVLGKPGPDCVTTCGILSCRNFPCYTQLHHRGPILCTHPYTSKLHLLVLISFASQRNLVACHFWLRESCLHLIIGNELSQGQASILKSNNWETRAAVWVHSAYVSIQVHLIHSLNSSRRECSPQWNSLATNHYAY